MTLVERLAADAIRTFADVDAKRGEATRDEYLKATYGAADAFKIAHALTVRTWFPTPADPSDIADIAWYELTEGDRSVVITRQIFEKLSPEVATSVAGFLNDWRTEVAQMFAPLGPMSAIEEAEGALQKRCPHPDFVDSTKRRVKADTERRCATCDLPESISSRCNVCAEPLVSHDDVACRREYED
jgi:hypothetical protein